MAEAARERRHAGAPVRRQAVITGQGTVGLELLEDVPDVDTVVVPLGGGGLLSGIALRDQGAAPGGAGGGRAGGRLRARRQLARAGGSSRCASDRARSPTASPSSGRARSHSRIIRELRGRRRHRHRRRDRPTHRAPGGAQQDRWSRAPARSGWRRCWPAA